MVSIGCGPWARESAVLTKLLLGIESVENVGLPQGMTLWLLLPDDDHNPICEGSFVETACRMLPHGISSGMLDVILLQQALLNGVVG